MARTATALLLSLAALTATAAAPAAPPRVTAWYVYATTLEGLKAEAYNRGCSFARNHPGSERVLLLDFGAARRTGTSSWGALSFGGHLFSNAEILAGLKAAADGHHNCYVRGETIVAYGNSNYHMSSSGMTQSDAYNVGYYQSYRAQQLASYQQSAGYNRQTAAAASDIEPSWDGAPISRRIVDGASMHGYALLYDFGSADGCPSSGSGGTCNNGWAVGDVAHVSFSGSAVPLPEIYYTVNADQWTVVRRWWNASATGGYFFWGTTATAGVGLTPAQGWDALAARNPGLVYAELVCFC